MLSLLIFAKFDQEHFKFTILNSVIVTRSSDLMELVNSEARVMLLYCTKEEAVDILASAEELKITGLLSIFYPIYNKKKTSTQSRRKLRLGCHSKCDRKCTGSSNISNRNVRCTL